MSPEVLNVLIAAVASILTALGTILLTGNRMVSRNLERVEQLDTERDREMEALRLKIREQEAENEKRRLDIEDRQARVLENLDKTTLAMLSLAQATRDTVQQTGAAVNEQHLAVRAMDRRVQEELSELAGAVTKQFSRLDTWLIKEVVIILREVDSVRNAIEQSFSLLPEEIKTVIVGEVERRFEELRDLLTAMPDTRPREEEVESAVHAEHVSRSQHTYGIRPKGAKHGTGYAYHSLGVRDGSADHDLRAAPEQAAP